MRVEEGFAPLERKLQGRHLTMIASSSPFSPGGLANLLQLEGSSGLVCLSVRGTLSQPLDLEAL